VQRGRRWSVAEKACGHSPSQLFAWKRRVLEGGHAAVEANEDVVAASRVRELEKRVRDLERMLGRKTMENEILKEGIEVARLKKQTMRLVSWNDPEDSSR
jgi:transposase